MRQRLNVGDLVIAKHNYSKNWYNDLEPGQIRRIKKIFRYSGCSYYEVGFDSDESQGYYFNMYNPKFFRKLSKIELAKLTKLELLFL